MQKTILAGFIAGVFGNIPKTIQCLFLHHKGISKLKCSDLLAGFFLPAKQVKTKKGMIFSIGFDFIVAGFNGISYILMLTLTGNKQSILKGWLTGLMDFAFYRGIVVKFGKGQVYSKDMITNLVMAVNSSVWGISTALIYKELQKRFFAKPISQTDYIQPDENLQQISSLYKP